MPCGQPIGWLTRTCDIRVSGGGSLGNGTTRSPLPAPDVENAGGFGQAAPDIVKPAVSTIANNRSLTIADISAAFAHMHPVGWRKLAAYFVKRIQQGAANIQSRRSGGDPSIHQHNHMAKVLVMDHSGQHQKSNV